MKDGVSKDSNNYSLRPRVLHHAVLPALGSGESLLHNKFRGNFDIDMMIILLILYIKFIKYKYRYRDLGQGSILIGQLKVGQAGQPCLSRIWPKMKLNKDIDKGSTDTRGTPGSCSSLQLLAFPLEWAFPWEP